MGILRFLLAISVLINHSSPIFGFSLVGGHLAVQAFFIISGFYMSLILNEKYIGINNSYKLFITNRLLRLYPVYWTVILLIVLYSVVAYVLTNGHGFGKLDIYSQYFDKMSISTLLFLVLTNIFLFFQDIVMFLGLDTTTGQLFFTSNFGETKPHLFDFLLIAPAWSVGLELAFYLIAPFLVRCKLIVIIILIGLSLLLRIILFYNGFSHDPWTYRFFPTELFFFLLGIVAYKIYTHIQNTTINPLYLKIIFGLILSFTLFFNFLSIPIGSYIYLLVFFIALPFIFILTKKWKKDRYIGELSYPIYISHLFILGCLSLLSKKFNFIETMNIGFSLTITTVIFSILLNEFIAKKIEQIRQKRIVPTLNEIG
jgi:peptidoglycan/LPS O-acetylase OafA/YrhL